jgi:CHAD domain-containing protein
VTGQGSRRAATRNADASTAASVVQDHLREQVAILLGRARCVLDDEPDAVHQMRVATRRIRSALATCRRLLDRDRTEPIRAELRWLGQVLGRARDAEVMQERLSDLLAEQPPDLVLGPVPQRLRVETHERHRAALDELARVLAEPRYRSLAGDLERLAAAAPFRRRARRSSARVLPALVGDAARRVDRAATSVELDSADRDRRLHDVRKAAKRARYAAESARPAVGKPARKLARRMEQLQELLGEHQDAVEAQRVLREIGSAAFLAGENGFTFGLLHNLESVRQERVLDCYPAVLGAAADPALRTWTRR